MAIMGQLKVEVSCHGFKMFTSVCNRGEGPYTNESQLVWNIRLDWAGICRATVYSIPSLQVTASSGTFPHFCMESGMESCSYKYGIKFQWKIVEYIKTMIIAHSYCS